MTIASAEPRPAAESRATNLVHWGAVFSGVIIGLGMFALLNSLWLALAYDTPDGWISRNLGWFVGASAAVALFLAGLLAGTFAGVRGSAAGLVNGTTAWGLLFGLSLTAIIPGALDLTSRLGTGLGQGSDSLGGPLASAGGGFTVETALWTGFWSLVAGLILAAAGGSVGGAFRRPVTVAALEPRGDESAGTSPAAPARRFGGTESTRHESVGFHETEGRRRRALLR